LSKTFTQIELLGLP